LFRIFFIDIDKNYFLFTLSELFVIIAVDSWYLSFNIS